MDFAFQYPASLQAHQKEEDWENVSKKHQITNLYSNVTEEAGHLKTNAEEFILRWAEHIQNSGFLRYKPGPLTKPTTQKFPQRRKIHTIKTIPSKTTQALKLVTKKEAQHEEDKFQTKTPPTIVRRKKRRKFRRNVKEDQDEILPKTRNAEKIHINISENKDKEEEQKPVKDTKCRIIRLIFRDPDATESSSDNEDERRQPDRSIHIQEISIPIGNSAVKSRKLKDNVERLRKNNLLSLLKTCPKKKRSKRWNSSKKFGIVSSMSSPLSVLDFKIPGPIPDFHELVLSVGHCLDNFFEGCPEYP